MADHKRSSLVDDSFSSVGASKKASKSSSGGSNNALKIGLVIVCFIVAGLGIAYSQGVFEAKPKPVVRTEADNKAAAESQKAQDAAKQAPRTTIGGS